MKKRLIVFLSAILLIMAIMVPASAATLETPAVVEEPVVARYEPMPCCGVMGVWQTRWDVVNWNGGRTVTCRFGYSSCSGDYGASKYSGHRCAACGYVGDSSLLYVGYYCPVAGNYIYY